MSWNPISLLFGTCHKDVGLKGLSHALARGCREINALPVMEEGRGESESWERAKKLLLGAVDVVLQLKGETSGHSQVLPAIKNNSQQNFRRNQAKEGEASGHNQVKKKVLMKSIDACLVTSHLKWVSST